MTIHIMLNTETWGTRPGCDIRSIGACVFDPVSGMVTGPDFVPEHTFYVACENPLPMAHILDSFQPPIRRYSLHRDPRAVQWWSEQSDEAQAAFADPVDLREALVSFGDWLASLRAAVHNEDRVYLLGASESPPDDLRIWSHGAAFILAAAYEAVGLPVPWHYRAPRDTRTLFDLAGVTDHSAWLPQHPGPLGQMQHALDDAICQARAVCAAWTSITPTLGDMEGLLTQAVGRVFTGMPERMAQEPVRCGVHHIGTLWSVSGEIARTVLLTLSAAPASPIPTSVANKGERYAQIAECAFDDRPRSRVGHPSQMDWDDGYREGTQAAGAAIRAALSPALDNTAVEGLTDEQYKRLGYKLTAPLSDWFIRNGDRTNPNAFINTDPAYFGMECGSFIAGIVRASTVQTEKA